MPRLHPPLVASAAPSRRRPGGRTDLLRRLVAAFREHELGTYAAASAFRALVALVPLALFGLGLLGALGLKEVWRDSLAPALEGRVTEPVFHGLDYSVERILRHGDAGLIALAAGLSLWNLMLAVGTVTSALNRIHDVKDCRSRPRKLALAVGLALAAGVGLVGAALVVTAAPHLAGGAAGALLAVVRWLLAAALLTVVVGLVVRVAPAEHPQPRWASVGSLLVVACWIVASIAFYFWVTRVADFKSSVGTLTSLLVLTAYLITSTAIFLVGAQVDELLRKDADGRARTLLDLLRGY